VAPVCHVVTLDHLDSRTGCIQVSTLMSECWRFPQREQKRQYRNENEYNRRLTVHQCLRWDPVMAKKYQKQLKGFNTVKTVRAPQTSHLFSRTETGKRSV
jgi:hypothetical protein